MRQFLFLFIIIFLLSCQKCEAQYNFVPNPSFEKYDSIPVYIADSIIYTYYYYPKDWFVPVSCGICYYFNSKLNYVDTTGGQGISPYGVPQNPWSYTYPYDGNAQAAINPFTLSSNEGIRTYLETKLKMPLISGKRYCVIFYITLSDSTYIAIDQIGAYFSNDSLLNYTPFGSPPCYLLQSPQIIGASGYYFNKRNQWQCVSGSFLAHGGEQFMTIGNFKTDSNTNYVWLPELSGYAAGAVYHLDMISVIECDSIVNSAYAGKDTSICLGDSIRLGICDSMNGYSFLWSPSSNLNDSSTLCPYAKPNETTTYTLQQWYYNSFLTTDEVTITVIDCNQPEPTNNVIYTPNIFSPNDDNQNDQFRIRGEQIETIHLLIYNRWGNLVFESDELNKGWDGMQNGKKCEEGVYVYRMEITFKNGESVMKRGDVTLIR